MPIPTEDLKSIARILAAGYLRLRERRRRELPLDTTATSSPDRDVVNDSQTGDRSGNRD